MGTCGVRRHPGIQIPPDRRQQWPNSILHREKLQELHDVFFQRIHGCKAARATTVMQPRCHALLDGNVVKHSPSRMTHHVATPRAFFTSTALYEDQTSRTSGISVGNSSASNDAT